jgi:hypothetical protein
MRKAQMEIMGLAVIVIFLALGMFFVAKFMLKPDSTSQTQSFQQAQLATNFVNTLLATKANCSGTIINFNTILEEIPNEDFTRYKCGDGKLSEYFNTSVRYILNQTLEEWRYYYEMNVIFPGGVDPIKIEYGCLPTMQNDYKLYPLPSDYGVIKVEMKICYP